MLVQSMPVFSHSSLSCFESCPLHYSLRYVQRLAPPDNRESVELFMGKRVHEALALLYERAGNPPSAQELIAIYRLNWSACWHDGVFVPKARLGATPRDYLELGGKCLGDYYASNAPFTQEKTLEVESRVSIALGEHGEFRLNGVVDRLSQATDGAYAIHDYKTGRTLPSLEQLESDRQLALYQLGLMQKLGEGNPFKLVWHYLAFNKQLELSRTRTQIGEVERQTIKLAIQVQGATEEGSFPAKVGPLCEYCEYKPVCPAWVEDATPKKLVQTKL